MKVGDAVNFSSFAISLGTILLAVLFLANNGTAQVADLNASAAQDNSSGGDQKTEKSDKSDKSDKLSEPAKVKLEIHVSTKDDKPVPEASVYVRFNESGGFLHKDKLAELDLKTNQEGTAKSPAIPQGRIMIQVIAKGWHTFGKWYDIDQSEQRIQIKLEPPAHWY